MTRVGAIMSQELADSLRDSLESDNVSVVLLGRSFASAREVGSVNGLICELSERTLEGFSNTFSLRASVPVAGLPVASDAVALADASGIMTVLRSPEDLSAWLSSLPAQDDRAEPPSGGTIIAVWGPAGAPGRTTVAVSLAGSLVRRRERVVLIDGDTHAPSIAPLMGLTSAQPGAVALSRQARLEGVEATALEACAVNFLCGDYTLPVVTGLASPAQYVDCGFAAWSTALTTLKSAGHTLLVDLAAPLSQLAHETLGGPMRNAVAMATLAVADRVVVVANPTPLSILRLSRDWPRLRELAGEAVLEVCLNNVPARSDAAVEQSVQALWQFTGTDEVTPLPHDRLWSGTTSAYDELLSGSGGKNLLMMAIDAFVTTRLGITGQTSHKSAKARAGSLRNWRLPFPHPRTGKNRLP